MTLLVTARDAYESGFTLDVSFTVDPGVTALCGPSGSGKTTILQLIAGLRRPSAGRIVLDEEVLVDTARGMWLPPERRGVGVVFQSNRLFPHRRVRGNLRYGLTRRPRRSVRFDRVVTVLELDALLERDVRSLSGGEARRVAMGRALLRGPRLLILDEPWTGLDATKRERLTTLIARCTEEWAIPTVVVSHDDTAMASLATRRIEIRAGRVMGSGE